MRPKKYSLRCLFVCSGDFRLPIGGKIYTEEMTEGGCAASGGGVMEINYEEVCMHISIFEISEIYLFCRVFSNYLRHLNACISVCFIIEFVLQSLIIMSEGHVNEIYRFHCFII